VKLPSTTIALLTGGSDKPYALGLSSALAVGGTAIDFVGSDELDCAAVHAIPNLRFLNLRGAQREDVSFLEKAGRIFKYYARLMSYAARTPTPVLHILWNNKFELFDRTLLMAYYRLVGKRVVLTAHNVNMAARDGRDRWLNRLSLRIQYRLCHHIFVHTSAMKAQLVNGFRVPADRVTVIPFGINDTIPRSGMTRAAARQKLGIGGNERTLLCFGQIAPYKGLEYLVEALAILARKGDQVRLIVAGKVKRGHEDYWSAVQGSIAQSGIGDRVTKEVRFIPDEQVEPFLVASDAVVLPYVEIFQSGVPFLAFSFGLPVIATDVGSLRDDVTSDTGILCKPKDAADVARAITEFFNSSLYSDPGKASARIRSLAAERHSWQTVSERTQAVYASLSPGLADRDFGAARPQDRKALSKCRE
jgi:glycosyltransferase involved in cell wall biosynthesis